jgi:hypothetical protein
VELSRFAIPGSFVLEHVHLSWTDALFGLDHGIIAPGAAAEIAATRVTAYSAPALVELASAVDGDVIRDLVVALATAERPGNADAMRERLLYLVLAYTYEQRAHLVDPLAVVETVYADLGYPDSIEHLIRPTPAREPGASRCAASEGRLLAHWRAYLERTAPTMRPVSVPMEELLEAAGRVLGVAPETAVPDSLAAHRDDVPWRDMPAWDTLTDRELARYTGLDEVRFTGTVWIATEVSFDADLGPFAVPAAAVPAFIENHPLWFGEPFFHGDVVLVCPDAGLAWLFYQGAYAILTRRAEDEPVGVTGPLRRRDP